MEYVGPILLSVVILLWLAIIVSVGIVYRNNQQLQRKCSELNTTVHKKTKEVGDQITRVCERDKRIAELEAAAKKQEKESFDTLWDVDKLRCEANDKVKTLEQEAKVRQLKMDQMEVNCRQAIETTNELAEKIKAERELRRVAQEASDQSIATLTTENDDMAAENVRAAALYANALNDYQRLTAENQSLEETALGLTNERDGLKELVTQCHQEIAVLMKSVEQLSKQVGFRASPAKPPAKRAAAKKVAAKKAKGVRK